MMLVDLMTTEFKTAALIGMVPGLEKIYYAGVFADNCRRYNAIVSGVETVLLVNTVIRRNESLMWEAAKDLLNRAVKDASLRVRGIYTFDVLTFNACREVQTFQHQELSQMLFNTALRLRPGEEVLVRYSSLCGIFRKLVDESWGRITLNVEVEVLPEKPGSLYSLMGQVLKKAAPIAQPVTILVNDLSEVPLYDPLCEEQQKFLVKLINNQSKNPPLFPRFCLVDWVCIFPVNV